MKCLAHESEAGGGRQTGSRAWAKLSVQSLCWHAEALGVLLFFVLSPDCTLEIPDLLKSSQ